MWWGTGPTVTAGRPAANSPAVTPHLRTVHTVTSGPETSTPQAGRTSRFLALAVSILVLVSVVFVGLQRLAVGFTGADPTSPTTTLTAPATPTPPSSGAVSSATGSLATPDDDGSATDDPGAAVSEPSSGASVDQQSSAFENPDTWPELLPDLGEHRVLTHSTGPEQRWVIAVPGGPQLSGGRFLAGLERLGWQVDAVSTVNTVTAVGAMGSSRVSVTVRSGEGLAPAGWGVLEVVYLDRIPDFEPPTTTTPPTDEEAARRRS